MSSVPARAEWRTIARHAGSVLAGQLAVMAFGVTDTVVAGRYSDTALAALSVGSAVYISVYVSLIGIVQALLPVFAELHGAQRHEELGRTLHQSLYLCAAVFVTGLALMLTPGPLLRWTEVPAQNHPVIEAYLAVLAGAFAPALLFRMYAVLCQALGRPMLVTWIQIAALGMKIPLSIWFVAGGAGLEPMGAVGCAWATLIVNYLMAAIACILLYRQPLYQALNLWRMPLRPQGRQILQFARMGVPSGVGTMIEITSFTLMALFLARLGTVASAGHQIAVSVAAMLYMFPLSLGVASSARVAYWIGAGNATRARNAVRIGLKLTWASSTALFLVLWVSRDFFAGLYSASTAVAHLASVLLGWVAFYHLADATQCVCIFLLRCYRITVAPMLIYGIFLWCLGLLGGYGITYQGWLGHAAWESPAGFWAAATLALWCVAVVMMWMLFQAARRSR